VHNNLHNLIHGHDNDESHDEPHDLLHEDTMKAPSAPQFAPKAAHPTPAATAEDKLKIMAQIPECSNLLNSIHSHLADLKSTAESTSTSTKTGLTDWFVNQAIDSSIEKSLLKSSMNESIMGGSKKYGQGKEYNTAEEVDKLSSEINSALTDPIHAVPLVTYDKNFEPIGTVQTKGLEKSRHFANKYASHSYLRTGGPSYPAGLNTIGKIISGCHNKINECVMHCRMEFSYVKRKDDLTGEVTYWTANQHGRFAKTSENRYLEFMGKVRNCSVSCLTKHKCIHDITFLHRHYSNTCYGLLDMCGRKNNCDGVNNFTCMSNCSGDMCYPLYRFVQDIKDFKRQATSRLKWGGVEKK
jgi:hypothetical protein